MCSAFGDMSKFEDLYFLESKYEDLNGDILFLDIHNYIKDKYGFKSNNIIISNACVSTQSGILYTINSKSIYTIIISIDKIAETTILALDNFGMLTKEVPKPFDLSGNGMALGEAVCSLLVAKNDINLKKNKFLCTIDEIHMVNEIYNLIEPSPSGRGIYQALSKLSDKNIKNLLLTGSGNLVNDKSLLAGLEQFTYKYGKNPYILSNKSYVGHTLGSSGALDIIFIILLFKNNILVPIYNHKQGIMDTVNFVKEEKKFYDDMFTYVSAGIGGSIFSISIRRGNVL